MLVSMKHTVVCLFSIDSFSAQGSEPLYSHWMSQQLINEIVSILAGFDLHPRLVTRTICVMGLSDLLHSLSDKDSRCTL